MKGSRSRTGAGLGLSQEARSAREARDDDRRLGGHRRASLLRRGQQGQRECRLRHKEGEHPATDRSGTERGARTRMRRPVRPRARSRRRPRCRGLRAASVRGRAALRRSQRRRGRGGGWRRGSPVDTEGSYLPSAQRNDSQQNRTFMALLTCARSRHLGRSKPFGTMGASAARPANVLGRVSARCRSILDDGTDCARRSRGVPRRCSRAWSRVRQRPCQLPRRARRAPRMRRSRRRGRRCL